MTKNQSLSEDYDEAKTAVKNKVHHWKEEASDKVDEIGSKLKTKYHRMRDNNSSEAVGGYFGRMRKNGQNWSKENNTSGAFTAKPPPPFYFFATCHKCKADEDECRCHVPMHMLGQNDFSPMTWTKAMYDIHFVIGVSVIGYTVYKLSQH